MKDATPVGKRRKPHPIVHHDLDRLSGSWSAEEANAFNRDLAEQRRIEHFQRVPQILVEPLDPAAG
jgi:hypothetical protein